MYYPKSKVISNLYTNGDEYVLPNNKPYKGYYHKLFNGKIYTGKTPEDKVIEELREINQTKINVDDPEVLTNENNLIYNYVKNIEIKSYLVPKFYYPQITEEQYKQGNFVRYFVKKVVNNYILEINEQEYEAIVNKDKLYIYQIYIPFKLLWKITGNKDKVIEHNINEIENIELTYKIKIKNYFKNKYDSFYKCSI